MMIFCRFAIFFSFKQRIVMQEMKKLSRTTFSVGKFSKYVFVMLTFIMGNAMGLLNETGTLFV